MKSGYRARQKKRTNKKRDPGVRGLQARTGEANLQAQPESMPQPQSAGVAETDRTNKQENGGKMHRGSLKDKLKEALSLDKEAWVHIGMAVVIAVCISTIILVTQAPGKGAYNADMTRMEQGITTMGSQIADNTDDIGDLQARSDTIEENYEGIDTTIKSHKAAIESLNSRMTDAETEMSLFNNPPEGYLTGTMGNYILHAKASAAGNFTANVHLVFTPPISAGNATTHDDAVVSFYGGINWTEANRSYVPTIAYNSTDWLVSQVSFNVGMFEMAANTETAIDIIFAGLNSTYEPDFVYVEVYPVLKQ